MTKAGSKASLPISGTALLIIAAACALASLAFMVTRSRRRLTGAQRGPQQAWATPAAPPQGWQGHTTAGAPMHRPIAPGARPADPPEVRDLDDAWREYGRRIEVLSRMDVFAGAAHDVLARVATGLSPVVAKPGQVVAREGDVDDQFFLIESGTLTVTTEIAGQPRELARLGPGEFFGEVALLGRGRRSATVHALSEATLWSLSVQDFDRLLASDPGIDEAVRRAARQRDQAAQTGSFEVEERGIDELAKGGEQIRIGRSPDNEMVFSSPLVSRHHAVIESTAGVFRLRDLDSQNGTYVNGARVRAVTLEDGDEVWVGDERFVFDRRSIRRSVQPEGIRLDARGLTTVLKDGRPLLSDVDLSLRPGEFVGDRRRQRGRQVDAHGRDVRRAAAHERPRALQRPRLLPEPRPTSAACWGTSPRTTSSTRSCRCRVTLRHAARLRLPPDTSAQELDAAVDKALAELGLSGQADVRVDVLSGGQRKRSSIGVELLTQPRIFFLDEPTSGLDPHTEGEMMALLRQLADGGSTVVLTTHATRNVMLCDKVVFLAAGGHVAFVGTPQRALRYFEADAFDAIYRRLADEASPEEWGARFRRSDDYAKLLSQSPATEPTEAEGAERQSLTDIAAPGGMRRGRTSSGPCFGATSTCCGSTRGTCRRWSCHRSSSRCSRWPSSPAGGSSRRRTRRPPCRSCSSLRSAPSPSGY